MNNKTMNSIATILLIIGGINWGLVGIGMLIEQPLNIVNMIFGGVPVLEAIIYILVGLAAIYTLAMNTKSYTEFK